MQAGAFPIQSENSGVGEFIVHGENGFIVNPWDLDSITENLKHALINDHLVDAAVDINRQVLINKYSLSEGIAKLHSLYDI
jgi:glycosyltransferase involved in cell wall biosynthesis